MTVYTRYESSRLLRDKAGACQYWQIKRRNRNIPFITSRYGDGFSTAQRAMFRTVNERSQPNQAQHYRPVCVKNYICLEVSSSILKRLSS
jgi:hypothetical protein